MNPFAPPSSSGGMGGGGGRGFNNQGGRSGRGNGGRQSFQTSKNPFQTGNQNSNQAGHSFGGGGGAVGGGGRGGGGRNQNFGHQSGGRGGNNPFGQQNQQHHQPQNQQHSQPRGQAVPRGMGGSNPFASSTVGVGFAGHQQQQIHQQHQSGWGQQQSSHQQSSHQQAHFNNPFQRSQQSSGQSQGFGGGRGGSNRSGAGNNPFAATSDGGGGVTFQSSGQSSFGHSQPHLSANNMITPQQHPISINQEDIRSIDFKAALGRGLGGLNAQDEEEEFDIDGGGEKTGLSYLGNSNSHEDVNQTSGSAGGIEPDVSSAQNLASSQIMSMGKEAVEVSQWLGTSALNKFSEDGPLEQPGALLATTGLVLGRIPELMR